MIIVEGPDLSGKTTLCKALGKRYNVEPIHLGRPPIGVRHFDIVKEALAGNSVRAVYDRMCIGSYVFGQFKRDEYNKNSATADELLRWYDLIHVLGGVVIYAQTDYATLAERFDQRGDEYISKEDLQASEQLYRAAFSLLNLRSTTFKPLIYDSTAAVPISFIADNVGKLNAAMHIELPIHRSDRREFTVNTFL